MFLNFVILFNNSIIVCVKDVCLWDCNRRRFYNFCNYNNNKKRKNEEKDV